MSMNQSYQEIQPSNTSHRILFQTSLTLAPNSKTEETYGLLIQDTVRPYPPLLLLLLVLASEVASDSYWAIGEAAFVKTKEGNKTRGIVAVSFIVGFLWYGT